jgi:flagellar biosynthetic protein FliR
MEVFIAYLSTVVPTFLLIVARTIGMLSQAPVLGSRNNLPNPVRIALAFMLSLTVMTQLTMYPDLPDKLMAYVGLALMEFLLGFLFGFSANIMFLAVQAAGEMAGQQSGLSAATVQNPFTKSGGNVMGTLFYQISLLVFLLIGGHLWMLGGFIQSFQLVPLGTFFLHPALMKHLFEISNVFLAIVIQLSLPMVAVVFVAELGIGYMSKVAQQASSLTQDLVTIAKPVSGMLILIFLMPNLMSVTYKYTESMIRDLDLLLRVAHGSSAKSTPNVMAPR